MTNLNDLISDTIRLILSEPLDPADLDGLAETLDQPLLAIISKVNRCTPWTVSDLQVLHSEYGIEFPISALAGDLQEGTLKNSERLVAAVDAIKTSVHIAPQVIGDSCHEYSPLVAVTAVAVQPTEGDAAIEVSPGWWKRFVSALWSIIAHPFGRRQ